MPVAERSIIINASPEVLFKVITDYEKYPQFLNEVEKTEVLNRSGNIVRTRTTVNLIKRIHYTIDLTEVTNQSVKWTLVESSIMKSNIGGWTLKDLGNGRTQATYGVEIVPKGVFVPKRIISMLTDKSLPGTLAAFKQRAESLV